VEEVSEKVDGLFFQLKLDFFAHEYFLPGFEMTMV
jgi:hypothetical protein